MQKLTQKLLKCTLLVLLANVAYGQYKYEIDFHGHKITNMDRLKSMTVKHYKPILEGDSMVSKRPLDPSNHGDAYTIYFDEQGKITKKAYFRFYCEEEGKKDCIKNYETYHYQNGKLDSIKNFKIYDGLPFYHGECASYKYLSDSITIVKKNYGTSHTNVKITTTKNKVTWEKLNAWTPIKRITYFDDLGRAIKYETYRNDQLDDRYEYQYKDDAATKPHIYLSESQPNEDKVYRYGLTFNEYNDLSELSFYNPQKMLVFTWNFIATYDDDGNWTERKKHANGKFLNFISRSFEYYPRK